MINVLKRAQQFSSVEPVYPDDSCIPSCRHFCPPAHLMQPSTLLPQQLLPRNTYSAVPVLHVQPRPERGGGSPVAALVKMRCLGRNTRKPTRMQLLPLEQAMCLTCRFAVNECTIGSLSSHWRQRTVSLCSMAAVRLSTRIAGVFIWDVQASQSMWCIPCQVIQTLPRPPAPLASPKAMRARKHDSTRHSSFGQTRTPPTDCRLKWMRRAGQTPHRAPEQQCPRIPSRISMHQK
jgi:hypothetical protein